MIFSLCYSLGFPVSIYYTCSSCLRENRQRMLGSEGENGNIEREANDDGEGGGTHSI